MRIAISACLLVAAARVPAQTAPAKPKPAVHRAVAGTAALSEANAPGVPKAVGVPKTLYSLRYVDLVIGTGELAAPRKFYTVNYTGWLKDGKKFDSSVDRNQPFTFPYGAKRVITGWDTGFEGMRVGGKRRLVVPYQLAYGDAGSGPIPAKSTLIFDVELLGMLDTPPAPPAPPKPMTPPADATPKPSDAPSAAPKPGAAPGAAPGSPANPTSPAPAAPASAPGNPGHPDPAKLPGGPPAGV